MSVEHTLRVLSDWVFFRLLRCRLLFNVSLMSLVLFSKGNLHLKVQSCNLYNNKYMIASTQITNTEIFAFIAVLDFKLLRRKVLFINRKDNRNC